MCFGRRLYVQFLKLENFENIVSDFVLAELGVSLDISVCVCVYCGLTPGSIMHARRSSMFQKSSACQKSSARFENEQNKL